MSLRQRLEHISARDLLAIVIPALVILGAGAWAAYQFVRPAPPDTLVIATGAQEGAYQLYAERYREILARDGIKLELRPSSGALENLKRIEDRTADIDVAFMQGGIAELKENSDLVSIGAVYYEPLWVFYRSAATLHRLGQLAGKRIAIGREGSGTKKLALDLLALNGITAGSARLVELSADAAAEALLAGKIDAAFVVSAPEGSVVTSLLRSRAAKVMSFAQAEAYSRRFPHLNKVVLPAGAIDFGNNIPARDLELIAPTAMLISHHDLHPALVDLLIQAATEVHGGPGLLYRAGDFPSGKEQGFPLHDEARRYYKSGPPFLRRHLPFWLANLIERFIVLGVTLAALAVPIFRFVPPLYFWRVRRRILQLYGELTLIEGELAAGGTASDATRARLERLEKRANSLKIPIGFADQLYTLRSHIDLVRKHLAAAGTGATST